MAFFFSNSQGPVGSVGPVGAIGPRGPSVCTWGRVLYKQTFKEDHSKLSIKKMNNIWARLPIFKKFSPC